MTTRVMYQIEIHTPGGPARVAALRDALACRPACFEPREDSDDGETVVFLGDEMDWHRTDRERHAAVVTVVRKVFPAARVETRWLDLSDPSWDSTHDTDDTVDDARPAEVPS